MLRFFLCFIFVHEQLKVISYKTLALTLVHGGPSPRPPGTAPESVESVLLELVRVTLAAAGVASAPPCTSPQ